MYTNPPLEVKENLRLLTEDLDNKIPAKQLDRNLLIASWNIRAFGDLTRKWASDEKDTPKRDMHAILCIAEILRRFDVIAVQEVKSNLRSLRDTLKILGPEWSMILTDVTKGKAGNAERMAYIFDTRRLNLSGLAGELVIPDEWLKQTGKDALKKQFVRTPYAVSFRSKNQTFILVTLHVLYGSKAEERIPELKGIARWLSEWSKDVNAYHHNLIVMGDFNIEARGDLLDQTFLSEGLFVPEALRNKSITRSIFDETKYYDQIAWFNGEKGEPRLSLEFKTGGNYDFTTIAMKNRGLSRQRLSFMLSDHYPLWTEFKL